MPGTTEAVLHDSMKHILTQNSLWLTSDKLSAKQKDVIGWIENDNSTYTNPQGQATTIQAATTTMAATNPAAAALVAKIKGEQFIFCKSGKLYGNKSLYLTTVGSCLSLFLFSMLFDSRGRSSLVEAFR